MKNILDSVKSTPVLEFLTTALLVVVVSPHALHIKLPVMLSFWVMAVWKFLSLRFRWIPLNRWIIILFAVFGFSVSAWHYGPPLGRDPGVSFLVILVGLKLLEGSTRRDTRILLLLGYFVVITHFLYINQFWVVAMLFVCVFLLTLILIRLNHSRRPLPLSGDLWLTGRILVQALPFALLLFFLFPRLAGSLWLLGSDDELGITGMSDTMTMGSISRMIESEEVAFTAAFEGNVPDPRNWYWRAGVLWETDGRTWIYGSELRDSGIQVENLGTLYAYELAPANTNDPWIYALDVPIRSPRGIVMEPELFMRKKGARENRPRYRLMSAEHYINRTIDADQYRKGTTLPYGMLTDRIQELVREQVTASSPSGVFDEARYIENILAYFNTNDFRYTLQPSVLTSRTAVDQFLFESREGFCEHYAAAFTTLMRAAGIPARIVIGYLGGELNPLANQITVRQSDAHAWTETWTRERGWVRLDPTAAIAPERIENPISYELSLASGAVRFVEFDLSVVESALRDLRWYGGLAKLQWERWFVGFDYLRQQALLEALGLERISLELLGSLSFVVGFLILVVSAFLFYRRERWQADPAIGIYNEYCRRLSKHGLTRLPWEGPLDYNARCRAALPGLAQDLDRITDSYTSLRYGTSAGSDGVRQLRKQVERFVSRLRFQTRGTGTR